MIAGAVLDPLKMKPLRELATMRPWATALSGGLLSGLLLATAAEPIGLGWLSWVAIVPAASVALALPGRPGRAAVPLAVAVYLELLLVPSLPLGVADGQWGDPALPVLIGGSPVLAVALLAVPLLGLALYGLGFGRWPGAVGTNSALKAPSGRWLTDGWAGAALAVGGPALAWTALDFVRAKIDPGGLWGELFLNVSTGPAGPIGALAGPWALTLAVVAVNYGIALTFVRGRPLGAVVPIAATALVATVGGAVAGPAGPAAEARELTVAAIQPGYDTAESEHPVMRFFRPGGYDLAAIDLIEDLSGPTLSAARRGAEVIVWPEAAVWVDPRRDRMVRAALTGLVIDADATLIVPFFLRRTSSGAAVAVSPAANGGVAFSDAHPKQRPMWFLGEDAPAADPRPASTPRPAVGTMLGVDTQDAHIAASLADAGADLLVSSTHDWRQLAPHHLAHARTAAVASGLPLVRADWRFGSAILDPSGEVVAGAGEGRRRAIIVASVGAARTQATYPALGDAAGWAAVVLCGLWPSLLTARKLFAAYS